MVLLQQLKKSTFYLPIAVLSVFSAGKLSLAV